MAIFIEGTTDLRELAMRLEEAGNVELRKAMFTNIRLAVEPVKVAITASALATLPKGGGANEWVASAPVGITATATPKVATVAVRMRQPHAEKIAAAKRAREAGSKFRGNRNHNLAAINRGILRHPLFGDRNYWFDTKVRPGFFTHPCLEAAPAVREACVVAMAETAIAAGFK